MRFCFLPKLSTKTKSGTILMYLGPQLVHIHCMRRARALKSVVHRRVHFISVSVVSSFTFGTFSLSSFKSELLLLATVRGSASS